MEPYSETVIEKVAVEQCPKCGKYHVYLIIVEREVQPDASGFGVVLSHENQLFNVWFECPSLKESFPCQIYRVGRHGIKVRNISVHGVYRPREVSADLLFELVDNLTYDPQACESDFQPWFSELVRMAIRAFRKESDRTTGCLNFFQSCRQIIRYANLEHLVDLFDQLFALQRELIDNPRYRDHIYHSICVFLLGYYILNQKYVMPNYLFCFDGWANPLPSSQCNKVFNHYCPHNCDGTQIIKDLDYDLEWPEVSDLYFYDDKLLQSYHDWNIAWCFASLFHDIGYPVERNPKKYAEKFGITTIDSYLDELRELLKCHAVLNNIDLTFDELTRELRSSDLLYDHGLVSAFTLLKTMKSLTKESWAPIKRAALATALHNLASRLDNKITIDAERDPLSFLLAICDEIQEWGREDLGGKRVQKPYVTRLASLAVDTHLGSIISIEAILRIHLSQTDVDSSAILRNTAERLACSERNLRRFLQFQRRFCFRLAVYYQEELAGEIILPDREKWEVLRPGRFSGHRRWRISWLEETLLSPSGTIPREVQNALVEELRVLKELDSEEQNRQEAWGTA